MYADDSSYTDTSALKSYLEGKSDGENTARCEAEFVCNVVELMTDLRCEAEGNFRDGKTQANNRRGELCLSMETITDRLTRNDDGEPQQQLVSVIANQHRSLIEDLVGTMRRILRRKRDLVPISSVQQVDAQCLHWLAKQPGHYPGEKAGVRQKLMAVVREESRNTLENRVLKDFIQRVKILSQLFIQQHEKTYPLSFRVKEVKHLRNSLAAALNRPEINLLPRINGSVQPNHVLLQDARYRKLWELYRLVLNHAKISEIVWADRHKAFVEIFCIWLLMRLNLERGYENCFDLSYWIKVMPTRGCFLTKPAFTNAFRTPKGLLSCIVSVTTGDIDFKRAGNNTQRIRLLYIPEVSNGMLHFQDDGVIYVAACFSDLCRTGSTYGNNVIWVTAVTQIDSAVSEILKKI